MTHAPSEARALRRALRDGADPAAILEDAAALDGAHAAAVMALVAGDPRLDAPERDAAAAHAVEAALAVTHWAQKVETWQTVLKAMGSAAVTGAVEAAVEDVAAMPDGAWITDAAGALAPLVGPAGRVRLMARVLANPGEEAEGAKAVLAAGPDAALTAMVQGAPDPDVRRRVLAFAGARHEALEAAWAVPDAQARWEALRAVAWDAPAEDLAGIAGTTDGCDPEDGARLLCAVAARADRLGLDPAGYLETADGLVAAIADERRRQKVARKVTEARHRAGISEAPAPSKPEAKPRPAPDLPPRTGHAFALVNGYRGGLGAPHLRAASRAAALCAAFGHDLLLIKFPVQDADALVAAAAGQTDIGEDAAPLQQLHAAGRVVVYEALPVGPTILATTPHPDPAKITHLRSLRGEAVCMVIGLGKHGLPAAILEAAPSHYELTGRGVSLETATAMGILADRLAGVHGGPT